MPFSKVSLAINEQTPAGVRHMGILVREYPIRNRRIYSGDRIALLAAALVVLSISHAVYADRDASQVQSTNAKGTRSSSGWVDFTPYTNLGIYLPVAVNGHETMAFLYGGPTNIDAKFAESIGLKPNPAGSVTGLELQIGDLVIHNASAKPEELRPEVYAQLIGKPVVFWLGEELFDQFTVDIDYQNHRVAFISQAVTGPADAVEIPLIKVNDGRAIPLSINGAPAGQFELELGNVSGPLLVSPVYAKTHKLLEDRPTSQRLSGRFVETIVSIDRLSFAGVDFPKVPIALIPDSQVPPEPVIGGVGLPLLSHFRVIIDYSNNRLFAIPNSAADKRPIPKDRMGMVVRAQDHKFVVAFVSPDSPAADAGFKKGDTISLIDGKSADAWAPEAIFRLQMTAPGTIHTFTMPDDSSRQVKTRDFF